MADDAEIVLDGGEAAGSGQILRTALALSAATGRPFTLRDARSGGNPGLGPQHLHAARAVAGLCGAELSGAEVGSSAIAFRPTARVAAVEHLLDLGPAGSATLLLQTVCWPLALAGGASRLTVRGATHCRSSPTFHELALVWAPAVARLGFRLELELQAAAFHPQGSGELAATVQPARPLPPLDLRHRGTLRAVEVVAMESGLPFAVAEQLAERALQRLRELGIAADAARVPLPARDSAGSHLLLVASFARTRCGFGALGEPGEPPERTADEAAKGLAEFLRCGAAVDPYLGDQLLVPAALAASGLVGPSAGTPPTTRYTVSRVTRHLLTCAAVVRRFLDLDLAVTGPEGEEGEVRVQPRGATAEVTPLAGDAHAH